ncbi:MAG TPA: sugar phosphate isomerase/epimerase [Phycisphaerales bacterium]|nr:sugar phosphate isomerase/epimerase [Phycisphaerales bacterium]
MSRPAMNRRGFLRTAAATGLAAGILTAAADGQDTASAPKKALQLGMLPKDLGNKEKFALAYDCGFRGIEASPMADLKAAEELGKLARDAGTPIHSIVYGGWGQPLSDPNPEVQKEGLSGMRTALRSAQAFGCDAVLLVPAIVTETVGYADAYKRSQDNIRKLIGPAEDAGVVIAVENVWNKFLLSPIEFARYIDEFESRWVRAYFDIGNVILFGFAQDWIRTLGRRIIKIHLKDFKRQGYQWTNLLDGDVNWPQVRQALREIGYTGYLTPELSGGDEAYLKDLSARMDKILAM